MSHKHIITKNVTQKIKKKLTNLIPFLVMEFIKTDLFKE